jgi:DNA-binding NarL/FixJ family response regulator
VRVVIADDSVLLREGAVRILEEAGIEVVGQAGDADDLLR